MIPLQLMTFSVLCSLCTCKNDSNEPSFCQLIPQHHPQKCEARLNYREEHNNLPTMNSYHLPSGSTAG